MRIFKRVLLVALVILVVAFAGFTIWAYTPLGPMPEALAAMQSGNGIDVQTSPWLTFTPTGSLAHDGHHHLSRAAGSTTARTRRRRGPSPSRATWP